MFFISVLYIFACFIYLICGLYVLINNPRSSKNLIAFLLSLAYALWSFSHIFDPFHASYEDFMFWRKVGHIGMILHPAISILFALEFAKKLIRIHKKLLKYVLYASLFIVPVIILYYDLMYFVIIKEKLTGSWYFFYMAYYSVYMTATLIFIALWGKRSGLKKERKQASIIIMSSILIMILCNIVDVGRPLIGMSDMPFLTPVLITIYYAVLARAVVKYRFLTMSIHKVGPEIINNIDESILILDAGGSVIKMNNKARDILGIAPEGRPLPLGSLIREAHDVIKKIELMQQGIFESFSSRLHFKLTDSDYTVLDVKVSLISDDMDDIVGVVIMGKEVEGLPQFKELHKITARELEVINLILEGYSNRRIAMELNIAERTVKSHIANIYNKLFITNKIQLMNFVKDNQLLPEKKAERRLLLVNRQ